MTSTISLPGMAAISALLVSTPLCALVMRVSRMGRSEDELYTAASLNFATEAMKLVGSLFMLLGISATGAATGAGAEEGFGSGAGGIVRSPLRSAKNWALCAIPVGLYFAQNMMAVYALGIFPSSVFIAVLNTKILFTALFSKILLSAQFNLDALLYLTLIVAGVGVVASSRESAALSADAAAAAAFAAGENEFEADGGNLAVAAPGPGSEAAALRLGLLLALCSALTSGLAGAYSQLFLQRVFATVWEANVVMGASSAALAFACCALQDSGSGAGASSLLGFGIFGGDGGNDAGGRGGGWFRNWTALTVVVAATEAGHGILSALAIKHTSSVIKAVIGASAIIVTSVIDRAVFKDELTVTAILGEIIVAGAALGYIQQQTAAATALAGKADAPPSSTPLLLAAAEASAGGAAATRVVGHSPVGMAGSAVPPRPLHLRLSSSSFVGIAPTYSVDAGDGKDVDGAASPSATAGDPPSPRITGRPSSRLVRGFVAMTGVVLVGAGTTVFNFGRYADAMRAAAGAAPSAAAARAADFAAPLMAESIEDEHRKREWGAGGNQPGVADGGAAPHEPRAGAAGTEDAVPINVVGKGSLARRKLSAEKLLQAAIENAGESPLAGSGKTLTWHVQGN
ncbi:unnamed protein product [Phaeothamnion confervicola]